MALSHKNFSDETKKKIAWVTKMYHQWHAYRHHLGLDQCDLDKKETVTRDSVIFAVCRFITEVKKVDGSDFPGKTLYELVICIQFHLETMGFLWQIINDEIFQDVKYTLDYMMKIRTQ